jgi:hypothetical protein
MRRFRVDSNDANIVADSLIFSAASRKGMTIMSAHQNHGMPRGFAGGTALALALTVLAGCSAPPPRVVTTTTTVERQPVVATLRPPPVREEVVPTAPSARVVWDPGRWSWNGTGYVWVAGHWVDRPYASAVWEPGHWVDHGNGWVWDEGHWRA